MSRMPWKPVLIVPRFSKGKRGYQDAQAAQYHVTMKGTKAATDYQLRKYVVPLVLMSTSPCTSFGYDHSNTLRSSVQSAQVNDPSA